MRIFFSFLLEVFQLHIVIMSHLELIFVEDVDISYDLLFAHKYLIVPTPYIKHSVLSLFLFVQFAKIKYLHGFIPDLSVPFDWAHILVFLNMLVLMVHSYIT